MNIIFRTLTLIICHFVGDYLFQTDYLAQGKCKDWYLLIAHCVLYCVPFVICFGFVWQLGVIFLVHIVVDTLKARFKLIPFWADQLIHYVIALLYLI